MTDQSPEIAAALARLPDAILDGELVVPEANGKSDFEELRRRNLLQRPLDRRRRRTAAGRSRYIRPSGGRR